jgi:hypothetical protein
VSDENATMLRWWRDRAKLIVYGGCICYCIGFFLDWWMEIGASWILRWAGAAVAFVGAAASLLWLVDSTVDDDFESGDPE